ncbi:hypothetical protein [uncultured Stenotrophomonas sp.]|uniref:hypothetical protein n=1 Tax=uncultured Stenotrophomonas sp. TaxID=165438 RepID=UPI0028D53CE6|nr:hypothetical protein [uncultured Stenotrophomonas sp.]
MANDSLLQRVTRAAFKVLTDSANSKHSKMALGLDASQHRSGEAIRSPAKSAAYRIIRDPSKSKAAMIAAELALARRPKRDRSRLHWDET